MSQQLVQWEDITVPVQDKAELIEYKKIIARNTDIEDALSLEPL